MSQQMALKSSMGTKNFICLGKYHSNVLIIIKIKFYVTCFKESGKNMFSKDPESILND